LDKAEVHFLELRCLSVLFEMYNYLINFRPVLLGAPLQLGASARLVRWVNPALARSTAFYIKFVIEIRNLGMHAT